MTDSNQPKKETVRITVAPKSGSSSAAASPARDTVRIHLPTRPPANPDAGAVDAPSPVRTSAVAMPAALTSPPPKKETARITLLPDPPAKPAVQMKKTQPLIDLPAVEKPAIAVTVTPQQMAQTWVEQVPMQLCWGLVAVSAAILILQIWNYIS
ncbi:MAG TPA: hypothetical protein VH170_03550 [Chthoniobacterales bacterium]|jgi:hypothetical protein|nr:hypothetical protein [Chthoniobacterales bacterium]